MNDQFYPFDDDVETVFKSYPPKLGKQLLHLRTLIFDVAKSNTHIGPITETLKWGQPSYLTEQSKSGTTIRLGIPKDRDDAYAFYVHCQTTLIEQFRHMFTDVFEFEKNRALIMRGALDKYQEPLKIVIQSALTYHLCKKL